MDSENLHRRLKKIIGQLNAIDRMIDEDVPHLNNCVKEAIDEKDSDDALSDLSTILEYYSRF